MCSVSHSHDWKVILCVLTILTILTTEAACTLNTLNALPPGYEDEILCHPSSACLRAVSRPRGWSGSRTDFVECCEPSTGETSRPRAWGEKLDLTYKEELVSQGWVLAIPCADSEDCRCGPNVGKTNKKISRETGRSMKALEALESTVDRISDMAALGFW